MLYLIGGAPTVGKSTLARKLAQHLDAQCVSTDHIREVMRTVTTRDVSPKLFIPLELNTAESYLTTQTIEEIVERNIEESEAVWPGIAAVADFEWSATPALVIEGINILPHLVHSHYTDGAKCKAVFLVDEDGDRIRNTVFTRGLWDDPHKYPDSVKEREVEWVQAFSRRIKQEALKHGYPSIEVSKSDTDLTKVLEVLEIA